MNWIERRRGGEGGKVTSRSELIETYIDGHPVRVHETYVPDKVRADRPALVFANGWGENADWLSTAAHKFAQQGERVVTMDYARTVPHYDGLESRIASLYAGVEFARQRTEGPVHIVTHSEGTIDAARLLELYRIADDLDEISGVTMVAPAGMIEGSTRTGVLIGACYENVSGLSSPQLLPRTMARMGLFGLTGVRYQRLFRVESDDAIHSVVVPEYLRIAADPKGPAIRYLRCTRDAMFPDAKAQEVIDTHLSGTRIDSEAVDATHVDLCRAHPGLLAAISRHVDESAQSPRYPRAPRHFGETA